MKLRVLVLCLVLVTAIVGWFLTISSDSHGNSKTANPSVPQPSAIASPGSTASEDKSASRGRTSVEPEDKGPRLDAPIKIGNEDLLTEADRAEVKGIDAYCKTVDAASDERISPDLIFADLSGHEGEKKGKWQRFSSEKGLAKAVERFCKKTGGMYSMALNFKNGGRIVAANLTSSAGDWVKDVYHYFREDGSIAFVLSHFGTFIGPYKFEHRKYFDRNGRLISESEEYYDFGTDEPLKTKPEFTADTADLRDKTDYYMAVSKLPFAHLLPQKGK